MKKIITIILICFSTCSFGQVVVPFADFTVTKTPAFQGQYTNLTIAPAYYALINSTTPTDTTLNQSNFTMDANGASISVGKNTNTMNWSDNSIILYPEYIKFMSNSSDTAPVTFVMHPPTMESIAITDIAVWDSDTLKRVHLAVPLSVRGFKTLITQK